MATIRLPTSFGRYAGGVERHEVPASTAAEALRIVAERHPDLAERLFDGSGRVRSHLSIVVGDRVVPDPAVQIEADDEVVVLVALAGGAAPS